MNEKVLLRTDSKTQMEILKDGINNGIETVNEARRKLDLMDKEGGDVLIVNGTYVPLTKVGAAYSEEEKQDTSTDKGGDPENPINKPDTEGEKTDQEDQEQETAETNEPDTDQEGGEDDGEEDELHKKKSGEEND